MKGVEPSTEAWEASILPLNYIRTTSLQQNNSIFFLITQGFFPFDIVIFYRL